MNQERFFFKTEKDRSTPLDLRRPVSQYTRGSVTLPEHERLVHLVRDIAWQFDNPLFVEVGVWQAKTSRMILEVLKDEMRPARMLNLDITIRAEVKWRKRCASFNVQNVFRKFHRGTLSDAVKKGMIQVGDVAFLFIDGCHCVDCVTEDLETARDLICDRGLLLVHDTDPEHEFGPKDQTYHGDKRGFGVLQGLARVDLESHGFYVKEEIPGVKGGVRGVRCGMRVYCRGEDGDNGGNPDASYSDEF